MSSVSRFVALLLCVQSVAALSFQEYRPLPRSTNRTCLRLYSQDFGSCTRDDFLDRKCSRACGREVAHIQEDLQDACADVDVSDDSILGRAKSGELLGLVCPNIDQPTSSSSTKSSAKTSSTSTADDDEEETGSTIESSATVTASTTQASSTSDLPEEDPSTTSSSDAQETFAPASDNGRGGSPFDITAYSGAPHQLVHSIMGMAVYAFLAL